MTVFFRQNERRVGEAGFTLLELLIATTVLAFLSLLLFGGLRFGTRVWEKTETSTTATNRVRSAQLVLSDEITQIYPFYAGTATVKHVDFDGQDQRVTFFAPSKILPGSMDLVTVQSVREKRGISVVIASKPELEGIRGTVSNFTLIRGLKTFQISYYGSPSPATSSTSQPPATTKAGLGANAAAAAKLPAQWTSIWEGQQRLPQLIRIRATMADKSEWPDLVVSPRIEVDESCVLDQLSKYCQGR